jgi:hypothetical protein
MAYMMKGPVYNKGGKVEDATNVHTDVLSLDINGTATDATIGMEEITNDLIINNPMTDGDIRIKLGDTAGNGSFIVQNSSNDMLFKISSKGQHIENYVLLQSSGTTITNFTPVARFVLIDLSTNTGNVSSTMLSDGVINGQLVTIIVVHSGPTPRTFTLTINDYISPGDGSKSNMPHVFSNKGISLSLIWYSDGWYNIHSGTI